MWLLQLTIDDYRTVVLFLSRSWEMKKFKILASTVITVALLAACGGGGGSASSTSGISTVKVAGDSLADSGVFGFKWAMQGNTTNPMQIWTERLAAAYGGSICARYVATSQTNVIPNPGAASCTSYAVGGGKINNYTAPGDPFSISKQLTDLGTEKAYSSGDLLLVDGGGNDAADLVGAYLQAAQGSTTSFQNQVGSLGASLLAPLVSPGGATGLAQSGTLYMQALADKFYNDIKTQALDKGASKVAVLNMPGITNTPRFQAVLGGIEASLGAAARSQSETLFKSWVETFNARLASKFAGESRVIVIDFYTSFNDQIANPSQYGLTNVKTPACPSTGTGADGLPKYDPANCTATSLSAQTPPAGSSGDANWWKTYAFSDGFHPTIYGYQLLAQLVAKNLATKGWI
jgi:outer membrane lipase/esterase